MDAGDKGYKSAKRRSVRSESMLHAQLCKKWNLPSTSTFAEVAQVQKEHARRHACLQEGLHEGSSWGIIAKKRSNDARLLACHARGLPAMSSWMDVTLTPVLKKDETHVC